MKNRKPRRHVIVGDRLVRLAGPTWLPVWLRLHGRGALLLALACALGWVATIRW